ncbi:hypothetical protein BD324DRAFT_652632 [Kockovaella imperatae]|uniref:Uncharacterized protein n=1 Tax=Kockovaella imperatae TaxID=4999 RepID=A0A1Y1UA50_9TREE|nr:hypothetical protein BD324DRAFT_652632 [Kockovaella imperatae]ORX34910.1 hypothetical protein BD324DRAFT_652632 [Kockovaella imperatae]
MRWEPEYHETLYSHLLQLRISQRLKLDSLTSLDLTFSSGKEFEDSLICLLQAVPKLEILKIRIPGVLWIIHDDSERFGPVPDLGNLYNDCQLESLKYFTLDCTEIPPSLVAALDTACHLEKFYPFPDNRSLKNLLIRVPDWKQGTNKPIPGPSFFGINIQDYEAIPRAICYWLRYTGPSLEHLQFFGHGKHANLVDPTLWDKENCQGTQSSAASPPVQTSILAHRATQFCISEVELNG